MERTEILSKETLLCYLINELSNGNYEITTHLDREGCWLGEITIKATDEPTNEDQEYFHELAKHLVRGESTELKPTPILRKSDFNLEHDTLVFYECNECGEYDINPETDIVTECPVCGGHEIMNETCHEGLRCNLCNGLFDPWDEAYRGKGKPMLICRECYNLLED